MKHISTGFFIGTVLSIYDGRINLSELLTVGRNLLDDYYIDLSRDSLYFELDTNSDCYLIEQNEIRFTDFYLNHMDIAKWHYLDNSDSEIKNSLLKLRFQ
jgi:hypothetical protein